MSVIIPVYDRATIVPRAIRSVLDQSFGDFELIVVDDGSTDDLDAAISFVSDTRFRLIRHAKNRGASAARNTGVAEAHGFYLAFLDSDDFWLPEKLEYQLDFMKNLAYRVRASCTAFEIQGTDSYGGELRFSKPLLTRQDFEVGCRVSPGSTLLAERAIFDDVGPFCEELPRLEDWDWLLRCSEISELVVLNQVISTIDNSAAANIRYEDVKSSVCIMKKRHFPRSGILPTRSRLRFLSTLENELAATAYRTNKVGLALKHLLISLCYWPYRDFNYFARIIRVVWRPRQAVLDTQIGDLGQSQPPVGS